MRKAILTKFIHLLFLALVLNTFIALVVTSSVLLKRSREDMHFALESVDRMLDYTGNVEEQLMDLSDLTNDNNSRYTLIRMDGTVVADTEVAQVNQMENHLERKEVKDALATGYGYSVRRSGTLGMQMAYAAIRSSDGKYILRLSACSTGLGEYILMLIPAAFLSFGIAFLHRQWRRNGFPSPSRVLCRKFPVKWCGWMTTTRVFSLKNARMRRSMS